MRILTGIQPSGTPHIGNYFGAMRQIINIQDKGETFIFLADYHSLTTAPEPEQLRKNVLELTLNYLSCGVDPEKAILFRQSDVPQVCELTWILNRWACWSAPTATRTRSQRGSRRTTASSPIRC